MTALYLRPKRRQGAGWLVLFLLLALALVLAVRAAAERLANSPPETLAFGAGSALVQSDSRIAGQPPLQPAPFEPGMPLDIVRAKLLNAAQPFAKFSGPKARPFAFAGSEVSRERAIDCLASAMWYEAGDDSRGQRAVGQVVINRVRHPAFPATVCGVVFQGAERNTGCQFTFTCDGAMRRAPSAVAFARARVEARALLDGAVDPEVGLATHYHTDWVRPVWSGAMDKIAQVDTHLFFRWPGKQGEANTAVRSYAGDEAQIALLAQLSPSHRPTTEKGLLSLPSALPPPSSVSGASAGTPTEFAATKSQWRADAPEGIFQLAVVPSGPGGAQALAALDLCGDRSFCKVIGRADPALSPSASAPGDVAFLYVRDKRTGVERAFWNCDLFQRSNRGECLTGPNLSWIAFEGNFQTDSSQWEKRVL